MAILTKETRRSAHWYTREGIAMHEVCRKEPGPGGELMRETTVADARLLNLFPSVTGILDIFNKPQLVTWKINQAIYASLRLPKQEQESDEYYAKRVRESSQEQVEEAADLGKVIHNNLDLVLEDGTMDRCQPDVVAYVAPVLDWFKARPFQIIHREQIVVNVQDGFAGTFDIAVRFTAPDGGEAFLVIDYKTRKTKPGVEVKPYDFQSWQIAAYAKTMFPEAFALGRVYGTNLYVSSTEAGRINHVRYLPDQLISDYNCFRAATLIWRQMKEYDPRQPVMLSPEDQIKAAALIPKSIVVQAHAPAPDGNPSGWAGVPVNKIPASVSLQGPVSSAPTVPLAAIAAPALSVPTPLPIAPAPAAIEPPEKKKRTRRTKAQMTETAAAIGATAEPVNTPPPEPKPDIPPPVRTGPPVPNSDGQVAVSIANWSAPFVRVQCVFVNFCGIMLALHRPVKPKERPPVLLENDWTLSCPVTGLNVVSQDKVKAKGKSREEWLQMAVALCLVSVTEADIAETYKAAIADKQPAPPLDQVTLLVQ